MIKSRTENEVVGGGDQVAHNDHATDYWGLTAPLSSNVVSSITDPLTMVSLDEYIEYENTGGTRFGRCYHSKDTCRKIPGTQFQYWDFASSDVPPVHWYEYSGDRTHSQAFAWCKGDYDSQPSPAMFSYLPNLAWEDFDWDAFSGRAYKAMEPSLESNFSILNFFWELKDFKELHRSLGSMWRLQRRMKPKEFLVSATKRLWNSLDSPAALIRETTRGATPKQIVKGIASGHLSWEFAIKPFVSDLSRMSNILSSMMDRIKDYRDRAGIPQTRHYVEKEDAPSYTPTSVYTGTPLRSIKIDRVFAPQIERHATMRYVYSIPYMSEIFGNILGVMGQLGLSPSRPSIVWNAVPFTFLVDWFFDVGDLLDEWFGRDLNPASVTVLDFCCSQKLKTPLRATYEVDSDYAKEGHGQPIFHIEREQYQRERMVPTISSPLTLGPSSGRKVALAASLLLAVSGKRKR